MSFFPVPLTLSVIIRTIVNDEMRSEDVSLLRLQRFSLQEALYSSVRGCRATAIAVNPDKPLGLFPACLLGLTLLCRLHSSRGDSGRG